MLPILSYNVLKSKIWIFVILTKKMKITIFIDYKIKSYQISIIDSIFEINIKNDPMKKIRKIFVFW